ncbi:TonB-dependent receptor [candidate division KSB1 bacterium]|nr:TonB-dependent receptor [candidate division KSB1 bacterium]
MLYLSFILLFCLVSLSLASISGKITGHIIDAESREPLTGVNVLVEGTTLGAASDLDGYFVILNVPPGSYTVKALMIGYSSVSTQNVRVIIDLTTTVDFSLTPEVLGVGDVVVVAERPVVARDVSASEMNVEAKLIESLPVAEITQVVGLQAGVQGLSVRGGGSDQTAFIIDGFSFNDERSNIPYTAVSLSSVKEVKIQTGGFNAEYGNVRSGVVNVTMREGDKNRYSGTITGWYRPPAEKHFGPSVYDPNTFFTRPFQDPEVCWTGTDNGVWDEYTQKQYVRFAGYNAVSEALLSDEDPANDLSPEGVKRLWEWQHRRRGEIEKPDYTLDLGFGGPMPFVSDRLGGLRFFASYRDVEEFFIFPLSRDSYRDRHGQVKLTSDINSAMKLMVTALYGETFSVCPEDYSPPTGTIFRNSYTIARKVRSNSNAASILYVPGYYNPTDIYRTHLGAKFSHVLNSNTFYEINLQHMISRYRTWRTDERDRTPRYEIVDDYFVDEAPYGYYGFPDVAVDGMRMGGWMGLSRDRSNFYTTSLQADLTSQIGKFNQVQTGLQFVMNDQDIHSSLVSPFSLSWNESRDWNISPFRLGAYVQDKIEFQGFVANIGLRLDLYNPNTEWYEFTPYDNWLNSSQGRSIETEAPRKESELNAKLSPRLGISHPITENSKLYFNYGHFHSLPDNRYLYTIDRLGDGQVQFLGNPSLAYSRTVQYELGYSHNILDLFLLNIAAYYKDVTDQPNWIHYISADMTVDYYLADNNSYEDIRGFEFTLTKRMGEWVTGFINYTYMMRTYGYFGLQRYYENTNLQRNYERLNPYQEKPHASPYLRANIDLRTPMQFGPTWLGLKPLGQWSLNILGTWQSGDYFTYNPGGKRGVKDNVQWVDYTNLDLRLSKTFKMQKIDLQLFVDITNTLNTKRLSTAGFSDENDWIAYMESLRFDWEEGAERGTDHVGDVRDAGVPYQTYDPTDPSLSEADLQRILDTKAYIDMPNLSYFSFLNPRDIQIGVKIDF